MEIKKILIIDDDKIVLESMTKLFIRDNWNVDICQNGQEGLEKVKNSQYDCILCDVRMPGFTGTQVLSKIRELEEKKLIDKQHVIFMTGYADEDAPIEAFRLGAYQYIHKPFDIKDVLEKANACATSQKVLQTFSEISEEALSKD